MNTNLIFPSSKTGRFIISFLCIIVLCQIVKSQSYEINSLNDKGKEHLTSLAGTDADNLPDNIKMEWVSHYTSALLASFDIATAVTCDRAGNVYITGSSRKPFLGADYITVKYDASGSHVWTTRYDGPGNSDYTAFAIAADSSGNIYVTGGSGNSDDASSDWVTIKYNSEGVEEWVAKYDGPGNGYDYATAIVVDSPGNVYVTGCSIGVNTYHLDYTTIKYNSDGAEEWVARYNGPENAEDRAQDILVDGSGNIYVTGWSEVDGVNFDYATIKYNSEGAEEWVARYNGPGNGYDVAEALAIDSSGNIYVTGYSEGSETSSDFATVKYNSEGVEEWVARYNGPGNGYDVAEAIAIDGSGNIFVTGWIEITGTNYDYATIKYNSEGVEEWVTKYDGSGKGYDYANAIVVDNSGNIYVTGWSKGVNTDLDYTTIKYNSEGVEEWVTRYNGPGDNEDRAKDIIVDGSGNIYVTGWSEGSDTRSDFATVKYNSEGAQQWVARYIEPKISSDYTNAVAVDGSGNIYITAYYVSTGTGNPDYVTIKYNSEGTEEWVAKYNGPKNKYDHAHAIAVDNSGNIYVTGESIGNWNVYDYATIKYNSEGTEQWVSRYDGIGYWYDHAHAIAVDDSGNIYVTGESIGNSNTYDYATIKYNSEGTEEWVARYNGPGDEDDRGTDIIIDGSGNIYVTGWSEGSDTRSDFATVKYNSEGVQQWTARYNGSENGDDKVTDIAVDGFENIYVTGYSKGIGTSYDYATIKYNSEGTEEWVARYNGPGNDDDRANAIAVDGFGNIYVTGYSQGDEPNSDYTLIKYSSEGTEEWVARYNGPENDDDLATDIAVDGSGDIYVTGKSRGLDKHYDCATIKYNSEGAEQWVVRYEGPEITEDWANTIAVDGSDNIYVTMYSSNDSICVYTTVKYSQGTVNIDKDNQIKTYKYHLSQNYPNPFNPITNIKYSIPKESFVTIKVYDFLGKEITKLVNERKSAGNYSINFNARNLPSGVYFYRMQAGSFASTKKFVLLK